MILTLSLIAIVLFRLAGRGLASSGTVSECCRDIVHKPYTGKIAVSDHGIECQAWAAQSPHAHLQTNDAHFPADGSVEGASNYCRNFIGSGRPWCFTVHPFIIFDFCTLQICNGTDGAPVTTLRTTSAVITSPDSDNNGLYDPNTNMLWIIEAPEGRIIQFRIQYALIWNSIDCYQDGLSIFEADMITDRVLLCGNHLFDAEVSQGETNSNVLYIQFFSNHELSAAGFKIDYEHADRMDKFCSGTIRDPTGWLASPDRDDDGLYDFNLFCKWVIVVEDNSVIWFQVMNVAIQFTYGCNYADYLEISDDYGPMSLLCGYGGERPPMETRSNVMYVHFVSNNYLNSAGFNLTYKAIKKHVDVCGEAMWGPDGVIISPDSDGDGIYDNNANCHWSIVVEEGHVIRYRINEFVVDNSNNCENDFVWIYEPSVSQSKVVYCGRLTLGDSAEGETMSNAMSVEFHSDDSNPDCCDLKFNITFYQLIKQSSCGGSVTNSSGYITAPDFDGDGYYDFNLYCSWHILINANQSIFYQFLYIAMEVTNVGCENDYVLVIERVNDWTCSRCPLSDPVFGYIARGVAREYEIKYCGYHTMTPLERTLTNELKVIFVSDGRISGWGFNLSYTGVEQFTCDIVLSTGPGWIFPKNFNADGFLDKDIFCKWTILAEPGHAIKFQVKYVRMEVSSNCKERFLKILFIHGPFWVEESYCTKEGLQEPVETYSDVVMIFYFSKPNRNDFLMYYEHVVKEFSNRYYGDMDTEDGEYFTPLDQDGDGLYDHNMVMEWTIKDDIGKALMMKILYIDIERTEGCVSDFLRVLNRLNSHNFCGVGTNIVIAFDDNNAWLVFRSDYSVNRSGFNLTFTAVDDGSTGCTGVLTSPSEYIFSPDRNQDGRYENMDSCFWTVKLNDEFVIVFHILEIDIHRESSECKADYLEVQEDHRLVGRFCGSSQPAPLTTETNVVFIRFVSDVRLSGSGFKAEYKQAEDVKSCTTEYQCLLSDKSIPKPYLCDGYFDCANGDDERFCDFRCPAECECFGLAIDCSGRRRCIEDRKSADKLTQAIRVPTSTRRLDVSYNPRAFKHMGLETQDLSLLTHLNISNCEIMTLPSNFFWSMKKLKLLDLSYNRLESLTSGIFVSLSALEDFYFKGNFKLITFESESFSGLSSLMYLELSDLHIERISQNAFATLNLTALRIYRSTIKSIESNSFGGLHADGIFLNTSDIKAFSETIFDGVIGIKMFKTDKYKFCCIRPTTLSEDNCLPEKDEFSSCDDMIRNEILRPLIWLLGIFTILTNVTSIIYRFLKQNEQLKHSYGIFVTNLAVSDGLMGMYLLIIASADAFFRNIYIFHDEYWRHSVWCNLAGILATVSTEGSVLFICLVTLDRFLVIKYPLGQVRLILKHAGILSVIVWTMALVLAFLPMTVYPLFEGQFYAQSAVCLALPISRARPPGWAYAISVFIGFNSLAYLLVALGQWSIYREIKASSKAVADSRSRTGNDARVARNLLLVVVTDLLCWLPVGILGILALLGQMIEGEAYSWIAVVVLPVNAAVNPVLYTLSALLQRKKTVAKQDTWKLKDTITSEHTSRWLTSWKGLQCWQYRGQVKGYVSLSDALENHCIAEKQCLEVVKELVKLLHAMHDKNMVQRDLKIDDLFVTEANQNRVKVALVWLPKYTLKPTDYEDNIASLGMIVEKLVETSDTEFTTQGESASSNVRAQGLKNDRKHAQIEHNLPYLH